MKRFLFISNIFSLISNLILLSEKNNYPLLGYYILDKRMCCNFDLLFHLVFDVVPPQSSVILNEKGEVVSRTVHKDGSSEITDNLIFGQLEPFNEGSTLILTCDVMGGRCISMFIMFISYRIKFIIY